MIKRDQNGVPTIQGSVALSFFGLGLLVNLWFLPPAIWSYRSVVFRGVYDDGEPIRNDFRALYTAYVVLLIVLLASFVYLTFSYFRRQSHVPRLVPAVVCAGLAINLCRDLAEIALVQDKEHAALTLAPYLVIVPISIAWMAYFARSKRVKETFVYPLAVTGADV